MNKRRERRLLAASIVLTLTAFALGGVLWTVLAGESGGGSSLRLPGWQVRAVKDVLRDECGSNRWRIHSTETVQCPDKSCGTLTRVRWEKQTAGGYWEQKDEVCLFDVNGVYQEKAWTAFYHSQIR